MIDLLLPKGKTNWHTYWKWFFICLKNIDQTSLRCTSHLQSIFSPEFLFLPHNFPPIIPKSLYHSWKKLLLALHTIVKVDFFLKNSILTKLYFLTYLNFCAEIGRYSLKLHPKKYQKSSRCPKLDGYAIANFGVRVERKVVKMIHYGW